MRRRCFFIFLLLSWYSASHASTEICTRFIQHFHHGERPIMVVITSWNNIKWYKRNLDAVYNQKYENYRVIYIDDASTDGTYEAVVSYVKERGQEHRTAVFRNKENVGALFGLFHAVHSCEDQTIIATYDGDDWWAHDRVLQIINEAYDDPRVVLTYGQYVEWPQEKMGQCREFPKEVIEKASYRHYTWLSSQQRTFYAGLFKRIKQEDLMRDDRFFHAGADTAYMFPMLEMAAGRIKFISDVLYVYNQTLFNDFRIRGNEQFSTRKYMMTKEPYKPLSDIEIRKLTESYS